LFGNRVSIGIVKVRIEKIPYWVMAGPELNDMSM
jgi:hypothetical protein